MSVDPGRKVQVQVMMTEQLLKRIDAIALAEKDPNDKDPNRSRVIRRFVSEGIEREESK